MSHLPLDYISLSGLELRISFSLPRCSIADKTTHGVHVSESHNLIGLRENENGYVIGCVAGTYWNILIYNLLD